MERTLWDKPPKYKEGTPENDAHLLTSILSKCLNLLYPACTKYTIEYFASHYTCGVYVPKGQSIAFNMLQQIRDLHTRINKVYVRCARQQQGMHLCANLTRADTPERGTKRARLN